MHKGPSYQVKDGLPYEVRPCKGPDCKFCRAGGDVVVGKYLQPGKGSCLLSRISVSLRGLPPVGRKQSP